MNAVDPKVTEIKTMTVTALRSSQGGLDEFSRMFAACSGAFDKGDDHAGLKGLKDLIPRLGEFATFCATVMEVCEDCLEPTEYAEFMARCEAYEKLLGTICSESEAGNYIEVGDVLRFDFCDLMKAFSRILPALADRVEQSLHT